MKRIWNALIYGDFETKKSIGSVILFSVLGIGFIVVSCITSKFSLFIVGMLLGVVALIISQTFTLVDDDFVAEVGNDGKKESVKSVSVVKNGVSSSTKSENTLKGGTKKETIGEDKKKDKKDKKKNKKKSSNELEDEETEELEERFAKKKQTVIANLNQQELKRILKKYHVKKDHRPIIIDNSVKYGIKECPAFVWRVRNNVFLLLLEKEPRKIKLDRQQMQHVNYVPNVRGNRQAEYVAFQQSNLIVSTFEGFLPDYFDVPNSKTRLKVKHLYEIAPDIQISNRSIATVMDLLVLNFMPDDKYTQSDKLNRFFKRIYAANLMYKDRAYSITEYKESVEKTLGEMCYTDMPYEEFETTLENLERARFISQEYVNHYMDMRSRVARK